MESINIIGCGIGGMATAIGLQKNGFDYRIYEQGVDIGYEKVGIGISRNILPILEKWGLQEEVLTVSAEVKTFRFVTKDLKVINAYKLKHPALCIDREQLYPVIYNHLDASKVNLQTRVSAAAFSPDSIVVAADGIDSAVRKTIYPDIGLRDSSQVLIRGIAAIKLPADFSNNYYDFIGGNCRFAIIDSGHGQFTWYAVIGKERVAAFVHNDLRTDLLTVFENYAPVVKEVILHTDKIYQSVLKDIDPKDRKYVKWHHDNILLVGDAIHPMTPNMANGACLAIEDAFVFTELLKYTPGQVRQVFEAYQKIREPKINNLVARSWFMGKMMHQKNPILDKLIVWGSGLTPEWVFNRMYANAILAVNYHDLLAS